MFLSSQTKLQTKEMHSKMKTPPLRWKHCLCNCAQCAYILGGHPVFAMWWEFCVLGTDRH